VWADQDKEGSTALMLAATKGLTSVVHKLLELGAKAELIDQVPRNYMYVCMYVYTLVCIYMHTVRTNKYIHICIFVHICICTVWNDGTAPGLCGGMRRFVPNTRGANSGRRRHRRAGMCVAVCILLSLAPSTLVFAWLFVFSSFVFN